VDMSLAADWLFTDSTAGVCHNTEEQHSAFKLVQVFASIHIHCDRIDRIRAGRIRISKTRSDCIQRAIFRLRPTYPNTIVEIQRVFQKFDVDAGIKGRSKCTGLRFAGAQESLLTSMAPRFTLRRRALKPSFRIES
jgi:hypothetical protein